MLGYLIPYTICMYTMYRICIFVHLHMYMYSLIAVSNHLNAPPLPPLPQVYLDSKLPVCVARFGTVSLSPSIRVGTAVMAKRSTRYTLATLFQHFWVGK